MIARETSLEVGEFIHTLGDAHIYSNHLEQVAKQLERTPRKAPILWLDPTKKAVMDFESEDIKILDYDPHEPIKAPVAV